MTKKDFELIAGIFKESGAKWQKFQDENNRQPDATLAILTLADKLASALEGTNERFNRELFLTACLWEEVTA